MMIIANHSIKTYESDATASSSFGEFSKISVFEIYTIQNYIFKVNWQNSIFFF